MDKIVESTVQEDIFFLALIFLFVTFTPYNA